MADVSLTRVPDGVRGPVVVVIMDGVGIGRGDEADAVTIARTPNLDRLSRDHLTTRLAAHGTAVGMPSNNDMGNSEVGHNAIGAGRIFDQGAKRVGAAIADGTVFATDVWRELVAHLRQTGGALHLIGLLSDGNVHSHIDHLEALITRAAAENLPTVCVHVLLDGRDVPKTSALQYVERLEAHLRRFDGHNNRRYRIASGGGRMVTTMDRYESDWSIVERGWHAHVLGRGRHFAGAGEAIATHRDEEPGIIDQYLPAFVIAAGDVPVGPIVDGDAVIAFNFRGDRMLQLCAAFEDDAFPHFDRVRRPQSFFCGMTLYDGDTHRPRRFLVAPPRIDNTLSELLCDAGVTQLACSETQKFGHVTYFWNGNRSGYFDERLERYVEIPSHPPPYDGAPAMRAVAIADTIVAAIAKGEHRFLRLNFANGDMVGHTGVFAATVAAVEAVDTALARLESATLDAGGALIVTADHGNADDMAERDEKTGAILREADGSMQARTSHSLNPVPLHVVLGPEDRRRYRLAALDAPGLGHIAATAARLLGYAQPEGYLPSLIAPASPG